MRNRKGGSDCTSESEFSQPDVKKGEAKGLLEVGVQRVLPTHIGGLAGGNVPFVIAVYEKVEN